MSEAQQTASMGRIEVAPEVLITIAHFAATRMEGVRQMAPVPADVARLFRRSIQHDGVLLNLANDQVKFDIYVIMEPNVNILQTSKALQAAVVEAIDTMVGIPVHSVNVHVENVVYAQE